MPNTGSRTPSAVPHRRRSKNRVRFDPANAAMVVHRSRYWKKRMVYILRADRPSKYQLGYSRIIYIGETGKGTRRPAVSAAGKAMRAFGVLRGVRRIEVHPLTFRGVKSVRLWEVLERDLLATFKDMYGEIPCYNRQGHGKRFSVDKIKYFRSKRLQQVLRSLS